MEPEDSLSSMHSSKHSEIALAEAYLQTLLVHESKSLTTINTSWSFFQYSFRSFGYMSSSTFRKAIDEMITILDKVLTYPVISKTTKKQHRHHVMKLLEKTTANDVSTKRSKCVFNTTELKFLDFIVAAKGY
ncbi:hypothetical protein EG68_03597 [Paragonimus skrjabini miyazakii]|uniref:Uncharacterized protein n=1 Tax=Paragonimus skrjabini miyazakii TaxID=59628 RepID=A0A8S9Z0A0_9TREM|nr:hypothetical protein EG68_03597 [Paragonimus skrjabini miyazakii]